MEFRGNTTFIEKRYDVKRIFWKALDQELERCDDAGDAATADPARCMTRAVEERAGCRSNLMKSDPGLPVCDKKENVSEVLSMALKFWEADENSIYRHD